jgi:hypothetical protein
LSTNSSLSINPIFLPKGKNPAKLSSEANIPNPNPNKVENGSAVPSQSTNPTSPLSKSTPNCQIYYCQVISGPSGNLDCLNATPIENPIRFSS